MTDNLAARLLAAIAETEQIARSSLADSWTVSNYHEVITSAPVSDNLVVAIGDSGGGVYDVDTAAHIAHNDPPTVLRRCEADRKMVELYQRLVVEDDNTTDDEYRWTTDARVTAVLACLRLLAEGYGVSLEGVPDVEWR